MCLHKITKKIAKPTDDELEGWKVFEGQGVQRGTVETYVTESILKVNQWNKADNSKTIGGKPIRYTTGFHVFLDKPTRKPLGSFIKKVKARRVRLLGEQITSDQFNEPIERRVAVADELYIPHKIIKKPASKRVSK